MGSASDTSVLEATPNVAKAVAWFTNTLMELVVVMKSEWYWSRPGLSCVNTAGMFLRFTPFSESKSKYW